MLLVKVQPMVIPAYWRYQALGRTVKDSKATRFNLTLLKFGFAFFRL